MDNMNNIKQSPLSMTGMGGLVTGFNFKSASADKTYIDDVFSTYLYTGNASSRSIVNGIDLSGEGGMVWIKNRDDAFNHTLFDTVRGTTKIIRSSTSGAETTGSQTLTAFNSDGFSLGTDSMVNSNNDNTVSWTFRKASKWMDIKQWSGNGTDNRVISHDLECIPGCIIMKDLEGSENWVFYHRDLPTGKILRMNKTHSLQTADLMGSTRNITSTGFTIGSGNEVNGAGKDYIAYIFQGGESDAATARSVDFDGTDDYLSWAATSDFAFGTGAYTVEFWIKPDTLSAGANFFNVATDNGFVVVVGDSKVAINQYSVGDKVATSTAPSIGQWTHYALVREGTGSNETKIYENGILVKTGTDATDWSTTHTAGLGANAANSSQEFDGKISNFRIVKGTAVYTSSFNPPTEPLTNITNTVLLCCNNSSQAGSTVTPGVITSNGNSEASTDSPFDDPAGFAFGDNEDQNLFKAGTFIGNGNNDGPRIYLGWEPQFILFRNGTTDNREWKLIDTMRGMPTGTGDATVLVNDSEAETGSQDIVDVEASGFKITNTNAHYNENGETIYYIAIRRPDGYVGKPAEAGTGVLSIATGTNNTNPGFVSGFPVDFSIRRPYASSSSWYAASRLTGTNYLVIDGNGVQNSNSDQTFDFQNGIGKWGGDLTSWMSWQWKRHAGFDVVTWEGDDTNAVRRHNLGRTPEMIWFKNRDAARSWRVYHKGLNGGTNPEDYAISTNASSAEGSNTAYMNGTAPTSTTFIAGLDGDTNVVGDSYIALLFASVDGISKVGYFDGQGSDLTVTFGFQPRFLMVKRRDDAGDWNVYDTTRGLDATSNDKELRLNDTTAESNHEVGEPTSTGFTFACGGEHDTCSVGKTFIYYAHA